MKFKIEVRNSVAHVIWDNSAARPASEVEVDLWNTVKALEKQHADMVAAIAKLIGASVKPGSATPVVEVKGGSPSPSKDAAPPSSASSSKPAPATTVPERPKAVTTTTVTSEAIKPKEETAEERKQRLKEKFSGSFGKRPEPPKLPG